MRLRNGAHVDRMLDVNPTATSAIAQYNALSPLLKLPLEVKNLIYKYTFGGNLIHITQNLDERGLKFNNTICCAKISEEEAQENFDSESIHPWYAPANEDRHKSCHRNHNEAAIHEKPGALSLSPLRSCRQMYNEAHHIPYASNTFSCVDPKTLQSFVLSLARGSKDNHLAVRSLFPDMVYAKDDHTSLWKTAVATCAKQLTALQNVSISVDWRHLDLILRYEYLRFGADLEKDVMHWRKNMISSVLFLTLKKLPLKTAKMVISDHGAEQGGDRWVNFQSRWITQEAKYRWTLDEKKDRARCVKEALLKPSR